MNQSTKKSLFAGMGIGFVTAGAIVAVMAISFSSCQEQATLIETQRKGALQRAANDDLETLRAEIAHLKADKVALEKRSTSIEKEMSMLRSQTGQQLQQQDAGKRTEADSQPVLTQEEEDAQVNAQIQAQIGLLEGLIRAENIDRQWTGPAEAVLQETFQKEEMQGLQLAKAECRTTICRMEIVADSSLSPEESFQKLVHLAPWQGQGFTNIDLEAGGEIVVYLAREGHDFPRVME